MSDWPSPTQRSGVNGQPLRVVKNYRVSYVRAADVVLRRDANGRVIGPVPFPPDTWDRRPWWKRVISNLRRPA